MNICNFKKSNSKGNQLVPIIIYHLGGELREVPVRDKTLSVRSLYTALNSLVSAFNFNCYR